MRNMPRGARRRVAIAIAFAFLPGTVVAGCGTASGGSPQSLLNQAKVVLDKTQTLRFAIASQNVESQGTEITGGQGDLARPDQLQGTFDILFNGLAVSVKVAAGGGKFYIEPPFQSKYTLTDPATYGLGNPADLIDPNRGLSGLLSNAQGATRSGSTRINGELLDVVKATIPGDKVPILPDQSPTEQVSVQAAINPSNHQLRQVTLVGPFVSKTANATYTVTLTRYGEPFHVNLPPT